MKRIKILPGVFLIILGILIGVLVASQMGWLPNGQATVKPAENTAVPVTKQYQNHDDIYSQLNQAFTSVAEKATPSVVTIFTDKVIKTRQTSPFASPFFDNPFRDFFGEDFWKQFYGQGQPQERHLQGMGSGVIVSEDGYVLTNNHVVRDADKVKVMLMGGKRVDAKIIGTDAKTDLAVLKIHEKNLKPITLGNSDNLRVGEWVLAIGSPLSPNLAHTVTAGIVSAKGRSNVGLADYEDFIQTDAAINPGNSGGALVNLKGELVGINAAIATETGGFQGIGFAVPINMARQVMDQLIKHGKVIRGWLGVYIQDVNESLAKTLKLPAKQGAIVSEVVADSPAEKAGLQVQDVILAINGEPVKDGTSLRNKVASLAPGTVVSLKIYRDGKEKTVKVELGELPEETQVAKTKSETTYEKIGFTVANVTSDLARQYNLEPSARGVVITRVNPNSEAYAAGLREGALITQVNRQRVRNVREFNRIVSRLHSGDAIMLYVEYRGRKFFAAFEIQ
ncbi:MAG: DegQ family serine endoprotease [Calditrichaeota bacterium]|nr:MAG: DegQ family serine endoprotease [Calditrichota bacterium]